ncbi:MAG: hypothetical protein EZS26_003771 [Candidatus Ordinivivax streblomastigis]|uniref:Winged helix-turn-helix domain-containing protein n=1 Tax=Candidatus Ordinivivax streblomastigis TaxID=2540710 RepID=A0A5M8NY00_9BACT|nr:MAG: hypothetical protein EZS26_003771 [Candidatus Ordinivivax streblomastigis]
MLKRKAGECAGAIWKALNGTEGMTAKELKKVVAKSEEPIKLTDKDLFLGFGWLLKEDKISVVEVEEGELFVKLI